MPEREGQVAIMYSGGSDSTLAAARAAQEYQTVHLLNYLRIDILRPREYLATYPALCRRFGRHRFRLEMLPLDRLFRAVLLQDPVRDFRRYRGQAFSTCTACRATMYLRTLKYCLDNGVEAAGDGASMGFSFGFIDQHPIGIAIIKEWFAGFGIEWRSMVWDTLHTDRELFHLGLQQTERVKYTRRTKQIQGRCLAEFAHLAYLMYVMPTKGYSVFISEASRYLKDKLDGFGPMVRSGEIEALL